MVAHYEGMIPMHATPCDRQQPMLTLVVQTMEQQYAKEIAEHKRHDAGTLAAAIEQHASAIESLEQQRTELTATLSLKSAEHPLEQPSNKKNDEAEQQRNTSQRNTSQTNTSQRNTSLHQAQRIAKDCTTPYRIAYLLIYLHCIPSLSSTFIVFCIC